MKLCILALKLIEKHWIIFTGLLLAAITTLSLTPLQELPSAPGSDKTHHFIAYGALVFPTALRRPRYWLWIALGLILWSGAIELIQPLVNRHGEYADLLANSLGVVFGTLAAMAAHRLFLSKPIKNPPH